MKKFSQTTLVLLLAFGMLITTIGTVDAQRINHTYLNGGLQFEMNGKIVTPVGIDGKPVLPITYTGVTYLPVRAMGYLLGFGIDYASSTRTVIISSVTAQDPPAFSAENVSNALTPITEAILNANLSFTLDNEKVVPVDANGIPVLPITYEGTTYLPVRALSMLLGIGVNYDETTRKVILDKEESVARAACVNVGAGTQGIATEGKTFIDDQGNEVFIKHGVRAFADKVVEFKVGDPAPIEKFAVPSKALGEPDFVGTDESTWDGSVSLGGGGQITLEFTQACLVDGPGADLHVFEVGPSVEAVKLEISADNKTWIEIGEISGGTSSIDIGPFVKQGEQFQFVRLTDLRQNTGGVTPGADIDAVAAVNSVVISGPSSVEGATNEGPAAKEPVGEAIEADPQPEVEPKTYKDDKNNEITIALGALAFADKVVEFKVGDPVPTEPYRNPLAALGEPDYHLSDKNAVSLGGSGQITLEFTKVYLVDGPGADLHVFEIGPAVEPMELEISKDQVTWIHIGEISGGKSEVDISPYVSQGEQFSYVRLTDLRHHTGGDTPGADIDAVAAVNAIRK